MRHLLLPLLMGLALVGLTFGGCRCGADVPTPVTLRIKNTSNEPVFVDATGGALGMQVQRRVGAEWFGFVEQPACACLACDQVCRGCSCDAGTPPSMIQKVPPGQSLERQWSGVVQVSGITSCNSALVGGTDCLRQDIPSLDETFRVHFCYASSAPGYTETDGGTPVPGTLRPDSQLCVDREFRVADGVVEVSPTRGADCSSHEQCASDGGTALCFSGGCTTSCPSNDYPALGGSWQVRVPEPDDLGFFTFTTDGAKKIWSGSGTVSSVRYDANTTTLRLQRPASPSGVYTGAVYITLPPGYAVPFNVGEAVSVKVIDASTRTNYENRAVVIRDGAGKLLLAADTAQLGPVLAPADTAPFTVTNSGKTVGCEYNECGKRLFHSTRFTGGETAVELEPGKSATVVANGSTYEPLNVANSSYRSTQCSLKSVMSYAILLDRNAP